MGKILLGALAACLLCSAAQAQTPSPAPVPAPTPVPSASPTGNKIYEALTLMGGTADCATLPNKVNDLALTSVKVVAQSMEWARLASNPLLDEAKYIAWVLLWAILFAEVTFSGFRLMLGSSIVEQLGLLTTKTFIYLIVSGTVIFPGAPSPWNTSEGIIRSTMFRMMHAGKKVGATIVKQASHANVRSLPGIQQINPGSINIPPKGGNGVGSGGDKDAWGPPTSSITSASGRAEPIMYWLAWIGVENACKFTYDRFGNPLISGSASGTVDPSNEYKYAQPSLNARIWGESPKVDDASNASAKVRAKMKSSQGQLPSLTGAGGPGQEGGVTDFARGMLIAMMPLQMFGIAMSVAGIQIGSLVSVVFAQMSILVGAITAFNIASALGLACLPLMYFRMFDKVWSQYLITLASLGLVPCFFYILSAIGFVFSTTVFEMLFPLDTTGGATKSLAVVLNDVFFAAVQSTMMSFSLVTNTFGGLFEIAIGWLLIIYLALGRIMFGSTVVAAFITGGSMFALLAPRFAFRWTSGFGGEDIVEKISEAFNGIQSAVGSGLGQMYSDALGRAGSLGSGFGRAMGGK